MKPLNGKVKFCYALGQFGWSILSGIISVWLMWFYFPTADVPIAESIPRTTVLGFLTVIGLITILGRLIDAVTDPLIASFSDASKNPEGRRIPFMSKAALPFAAATVLVFVSPTKGSSMSNAIFLIFMLTVFYTMFTFYVTPYYALMAELSRNKEDRIDLSTFTALTWFLGYIVASLASNIWPTFVNMGIPYDSSVRITFVLLAIVALIFLMIPTFVIDEKRYIDFEPTSSASPVQSVKDAFENENFLAFEIFYLIYNIALTVFQTCNVYYVTVLLGMQESSVSTVTIGTAIMTFICYPVVNILGKKVAKKKLCIVGLIFLVFSYAYCTFLGILPLAPMAQIAIFAVFSGVGLSIFGILPNAIVADIAAEDKKVTREAKEAMFFAVHTFMSKIGQMIAMAIASGLLLLGKDVGNSLGVRVSCPVAAVLGIVALVFFFKFEEVED